MEFFVLVTLNDQRSNLQNFVDVLFWEKELKLRGHPLVTRSTGKTEVTRREKLYVLSKHANKLVYTYFLSTCKIQL